MLKVDLDRLGNGTGGPHEVTPVTPVQSLARPDLVRPGRALS